ncbi:hypothetical protein EAI_10951 [Harpegnathos saltator]|uniref:Uncharacterized protein n=1 Tax=Harpegnathos saltator TaxID=610380 RepID=E2B6R0_HARSA|nr:hypothetical protein EAI_10951 [Harpegnathos saltator]
MSFGLMGFYFKIDKSRGVLIGFIISSEFIQDQPHPLVSMIAWKSSSLENSEPKNVIWAHYANIETDVTIVTWTVQFRKSFVAF